MASVDIVDAAGKKSGTRDLPAAIFEAPVNVPLMHQVVVAAMAGRRAGTHKVKTRGDVRGGGVKPWRQKGTGRARQGSIRAPQWTGGGVVHGPVVRSHDQRINKKMVKGALRSALTDAVTSGKLIALKELSFDEPKTKQAAETLSALECEGRVLLVLAKPTDDGAVEKSFRNLTHVRIAYAGGIGTYDVLLADHLVITADALDALEGSPDGSAGRTSAEPKTQATREAEPKAEAEDKTEADDAADDEADEADDTEEGDEA
jgi:large subunit ribosomal protein L4